MLARLKVLGVTVAAIAGFFAFAGVANAISTNVVISQVYGGGGNSGAPYQNDYI